MAQTKQNYNREKLKSMNNITTKYTCYKTITSLI